MGKEGYLAGKIGLFYDRWFTGGYKRDGEREGGSVFFDGEIDICETWRLRVQTPGGASFN